jgi:PadR family transcriptional regulator PadR
LLLTDAAIALDPTVADSTAPCYPLNANFLPGIFRPTARAMQSLGARRAAALVGLQSVYIFINMELMRKREYLTQLELMVLLAVMSPGHDAYGVVISREIAEKSGREIALASIYATLERLEKKGFIRSSLGEPTAERGGKARTYYKATAAGVQEARLAHAALLRLSAGVPALKGQTA